MTPHRNASAPNPKTETLVNARCNGVPMLLLTLAVVGGLLAALFRLTTVASQFSNLYAPPFGLVTGVWATLASDALDGVLYRPLLGSDGYGGTRYMPLHFILLAILMKAGLGAWTAQCVLITFGLVGLLAGVFALLRQLEVSLAMSWLGTLLILASSTTQSIVTHMQVDISSAACNVWGLFFCVRFLSISDKRMHLIQKASLCFVAAFMIKLSVVFGLIAAAVALFRSREKRAAIRLVGGTCASIALCLLLTQIFSQGRFLESMQGCASSGSSMASVVGALPFWLDTIVREDPFGLLVIFFAFCASLAIPVAARRELIPTALPITAAIIIFLHGSPGVSHNQNIDLFVLSVVLLVWVANHYLSFPLVVKHLACLTFFGVWISVKDTRDVGHFFRRAYPQSAEFTEESLRRIIYDSETARPNTGPILSQNPWVPILINEKPYVLDPFMLRVVGQKNKRIAHDFETKMKKHFFSAIVLYSDPATEAGRLRLTDVFFAPNFVQLLADNYELRKHTAVGLVFYPRLKNSITIRR